MLIIVPEHEESEKIFADGLDDYFYDCYTCFGDATNRTKGATAMTQSQYDATEAWRECEADARDTEEKLAQRLDDDAAEEYFCRDLDFELAAANQAYEEWLLELPRHEPSGVWCEADELVAPF